MILILLAQILIYLLALQMFTTPSPSLSLNIVLLSGGLLPAVTFGLLIVRFMQSLGSVLIRFLSLLITAAALLGCVCCTKFTEIRNTLYGELPPACQRVPVLRLWLILVSLRSRGVERPNLEDVFCLHMFAYGMISLPLCLTLVC